MDGGYDETFNDTVDGYVVKLDTSGAHVWSTYLGGTGADYGNDIAVDSSGDYCFVTGNTWSSGWVSDGWDISQNGDCDGYVVKLDKYGAHVWSTYLGDTGWEYAVRIAVDSSGDCFVAGYTYFLGWVDGGWDTSQNGSLDAYVVKLSTSGAHVWSTYLGGTGQDFGNDIAVDSSGDCFVAGHTNSSGWVSGGWNETISPSDGTYCGDYDGYVVKLSASGAHVWSTYLGGTRADEGRGIAVDSRRNCYVTGSTHSSGWVSGGWDTTLNGDSVDNIDAYVVKLDTSGAHVWSSYLGGTEQDVGNSIAVYSTGNCYVTGSTHSSGWVSGGWDTSHNGDWDGFVVKIAQSSTGPDGTCTLYDTLRAQGNIVAAQRGAMVGPLLELMPENWTDYSVWDIEGVEAGPPGPFGDGILDLWQLAIFADSYCNPNHWLHNEAVAAYEANLATVTSELPEHSDIWEWIAASVSLSSRMRDTVCALFVLNPENYEPVTLPAKALNEPFSAEGDCDGDRTSNIEEYEYVVACGGGIESFVLAASENSPFWSENPALPVAGIVGLLLLCAGVTFATARFRLMSEH